MEVEINGFWRILAERPPPPPPERELYKPKALNYRSKK